MADKKKYIVITSIISIIVMLIVGVTIFVLNKRKGKIDTSILNNLVSEKYKIIDDNIKDRVLELNIESNDLSTNNLKDLGHNILDKIKDSGWDVRTVSVNVFKAGKSNENNNFYSEGLKNRINISINVGDVSISEFKNVESNNVDNITIDDMNRKYYYIEGDKLVIKLESEDINEENAMRKIKEYIDTFKSLNPNILDKEIEVRVNEFYKIGFAASSNSDVLEVSKTEKF